MLGFLNSVESSLSEGAGENPVEGAKLGGAGLDGFSMYGNEKPNKYTDSESQHKLRKLVLY